MLASKKKGLAFFAVLTFALCLLGGCGSDKKQAGGPPPSQVKVINVLRRDVPISSEYAGQVMGKDEVKVQSKVGGKIVEKYVRGGQFVEAGQPLFKIDSRQYESAVLQAQATLAQAEANYQDASQDLERYQKLLESAAVAEQMVANQQAKVNALYASAAANAALLQKAQEDLDDTVIYAPMAGQLAIDDVAIGTYASPGVTTLVTIGASDPVYAKFSISETEYMGFTKLLETQPDSLSEGVNVGITLSDGSTYPYNGQIVEIDRALAQSTGALTLKALFPNPEGKLLPGMFARVKLSGRVVKDAIVVPQRAVQQLLGKTFVMVATSENKSEARTVKLGPLVGSYYIVESGLTEDDLVVIEGLTNLQEGKDLAITMVTAEEMGFKFEPDMTPYDADAAQKN
ncbi:MAG: efflux RND transporter periplasmic adaptor subunit [Selenomonadaceae bacterium]|nr:efflux RND transporter periplasmic adaptor subunit [Selenomonadaceae bacterium]